MRKPRAATSAACLRAFVEAACWQSFTGAAETLCVTQSAVSKQVQMLEQPIGVRLLRQHDDQVIGSDLRPA